MSIPTQVELLDLIAEEALIDRAKLTPDATIESLGIDSVDTVSVIFALEERYGVQIETDEISRESTLMQLYDLVCAKAANAVSAA